MGFFLGRRLYEMARTGRAFFFPARIATVMTRPLGRQEIHYALLLPHPKQDDFNRALWLRSLRGRAVIVTSYDG